MCLDAGGVADNGVVAVAVDAEAAVVAFEEGSAVSLENDDISATISAAVDGDGGCLDAGGVADNGVVLWCKAACRGLRAKTRF